MIYSWEQACIDDYKPLENTEGWERCPNCQEFPRTWVFDNGNFAKCRCQYKYEGGVVAKSIIQAVYKESIPYDEYKGLLRAAWNNRCASLPEQP
jgi:hypothetical protein